MTITYQGGDGNDVVLTSIAVNDPPAGSDKTISINEDEAYTLHRRRLWLQRSR